MGNFHDTDSESFEYEGGGMQYVRMLFTMSPKKWIITDNTNEIVSKSGCNSDRTFEHSIGFL